MAKITLKTQNQKVNELFNMFNLPNVDYTKGYQAKPRAEPVGASAVNCIEATRLNAVNELLRITKQSVR
jgi:hypothetical protein